MTNGNISIPSTAGSNEESWFSQNDSSIHQEDFCGQKIPVYVSLWSDRVHHILKKQPDHKHVNNITIKRDNRFIEALSLPIFSVYNMRSIWSKLSSLSEDMDERCTDFSILSEVWERRKKAQNINRESKKFLR